MLKLIFGSVARSLPTAFEAILANKLRAILTALGIIFGVSAVIAMLAIGNGAQKEILEQIKLTGVNNILVTPILPKGDNAASKEESENAKKEEKKFSPGLSLLDAISIQEMLPVIDKISPEVHLEMQASSTLRISPSKLVAVQADFFSINNRDIEIGRAFASKEYEMGMPVCLLSKTIATKLFPGESAIGKEVKLGNNWLTVVGILAPVNQKKNTEEDKKKTESIELNPSVPEIYIPLKTAFLRFVNRNMVTESDIQKANNDWDDNGGSKDPKKKNYHQLDKLVVQIQEGASLEQSADVIKRALQRRHNNLVDFEISIPELLLKQQQRTKDIFTIVLAAIAGISLAVGGIGIMNIMLANVLERIKEIGLRKSLGALKMDIIMQFLLEAMLISLIGGTIGVILGVGLALGIANFAEIPTIITWQSIAVSFGVAVATGMLFGIAPARKAAKQDPIESLRYE